MGKNVSDIWEKVAMSKGYQNWASEVAYFIDFNFAIFAMFKTSVLLIASECLKLDFRNVLWDDLSLIFWRVHIKKLLLTYLFCMTGISGFAQEQYRKKISGSF